MTIAEAHKKDKGPQVGGLGGFVGDWVLVAIVLLSSLLSFGIGWLAAREATSEGGGVWIEQLPLEAPTAAPPAATENTSAPAPPPQPAAAAAAVPAGGSYVASKTGTKYYLPWCGTAKRIKEENKVWFASKQEAEAAGYTPASNCKGL